MEKLIIVGTGGFGKEIAWLAKTTKQFEILGFIDDSKEKDDLFYGYKILGSTNDAHLFKEYSFVIAIGSPRVRKKVLEKLDAQGVEKFPNLISPQAILCDTIKFSKGNIVCAGVVITTDITIGNFNIINLNTTVGHDSIIHDFVTIAPLAAISGNVTLHDLTEVGTGATIRQGITIHQGSMLGMGSVLTKNIEESNQIFIGNPAKFFKSF